jgi:hypothetical protein
MEVYLSDLMKMSPAERERTLLEMERAIAGPRVSLLDRLRGAMQHLRLGKRGAR